MLAALLCLSVFLMLTGVVLARPLRRVASAPACLTGQRTMPDLDGLTLRSSPRVQATGRLIKGLSYSDTLNGPPTFVAFFIACDQLLEPKPFLVMDFHTNQFSFDGNRDGCADATGFTARPEIDPADFYPAVDGANEICDEDVISHRQPSGPLPIP